LMRPDVSDRSAMDYGALVSAYERSLIESAFERSNGTIAAAARILGITPRQLQTRVENLKIRRSPYKKEN
jgi:transcriptional regulator with GAF, ATPase, and Fis domain